jgi:hypothetical protein
MVPTRYKRYIDESTRDWENLKQCEDIENSIQSLEASGISNLGSGAYGRYSMDDEVKIRFDADIKKKTEKYANAHIVCCGWLWSRSAVVWVILPSGGGASCLRLTNGTHGILQVLRLCFPKGTHRDKARSRQVSFLLQVPDECGTLCHPDRVQRKEAKRSGCCVKADCNVSAHTW